MKLIPLLSVALLPAATWARADAAKKTEPAFSAKFLGENGAGAPATTGQEGRFLEDQARETPRPERASKPATPPPEASSQRFEPPAPTSARFKPAPEPPDRRLGAFVVTDPAAARQREREKLSDAVAQPPAAPPAVAQDAARRYALWQTLGKPVEMTPAKIQAAHADDEAANAAGQEYERRILGAAARSRPDGAALARVSAPAGQMFVAVDLALDGKTDLKDAVAGFSRASGFTLDPRFAAATGTLDASRASLRGWLPANRLADAIQARGVVRVEVDHGGPTPLGASAARSSLVIGLRIPSQGDAATSAQRIIGELTERAQLRWTRTIGFQTLPESNEVALVIVGEVPVTRIPRLLEHSAVLKIAPAPGPQESAPAPAAAQAPERAPSASGLLGYTRRHAPLLLLFTGLFLLPQAGALLSRLLRAFVPYRRR